MAESKPKESGLSPLMAGAFGRLKTRKKERGHCATQSNARSSGGNTVQRNQQREPDCHQGSQLISPMSNCST
jgi:hypothetical protein